MLFNSFPPINVHDPLFVFFLFCAYFWLFLSMLNQRPQKVAAAPKAAKPSSAVRPEAVAPKANQPQAAKFAAEKPQSAPVEEAKKPTAANAIAPLPEPTSAVKAKAESTATIEPAPTIAPKVLKEAEAPELITPAAEQSEINKVPESKTPAKSTEKRQLPQKRKQQWSANEPSKQEAVLVGRKELAEAEPSAGEREQKLEAPEIERMLRSRLGSHRTQAQQRTALRRLCKDELRLKGYSSCQSAAAFAKFISSQNISRERLFVALNQMEQLA